MILLIGLLFSVLFTLVIGAISGMIYAFIDLLSVTIVLIPLIFFLVSTKSCKIITEYMISSFKKNYEYSNAELESIVRVAKHSIRITLATGWFGFIIGIIGMLHRLDDPHTIGPMLAVGLLTVLYSIGVGFFMLFPLQVWAENRIQVNTAGQERT